MNKRLLEQVESIALVVSLVGGVLIIVYHWM